jgi:type I restriction enzyme S subunit
MVNNASTCIGRFADVVTGQVEVRGWQPGPDDVVDDAALAALGDGQENVTEEEDGDGGQ